jgi:hypothetical protein
LTSFVLSISISTRAPATTMQHGGPNREVGEGMERAIKHTYICGSDEWVSEAAEVSIAPRSFAQVRGSRFVHALCLRRTSHTCSPLT